MAGGPEGQVMLPEGVRPLASPSGRTLVGAVSAWGSFWQTAPPLWVKTRDSMRFTACFCFIAVWAVAL